MNNIQKFQGGGIASRLINANIGDIQRRIGRSLGKKQRESQKKESKWRTWGNILKTIATVALPGVGGAITGALIDPIARKYFKAGAKPSDIQATGDENIFGGREAFKTARAGQKDELDAYRKFNLLSSVLGFAGSKVGGAALEKWGGGLKDALGFGDFGGFGAKNIPGGSYYKANPMPTETLASKFSTPTNLNFGLDLSGAKPSYEQGGMVQQYQEGGQITELSEAQVARTEGKWVSQNPGDPTSQKKWESTTVWDTYEYDGLNWKKTAHASPHNPGLPNITQAEMDSYRSGARTSEVGSKYMETEGEGLNLFLRSPEVANLVNKARSGDSWALEDLVEMSKQMRPELANRPSSDIRKMIKTNLLEIDLYGEGYQETLAETGTTLEGLVGQAQTARGKVATQKAISGIRTPGGEDTISKALYSQAGTEYGKMQKGIQTGFEEEFEGLETTMLGIV